MKTKYFAVKIRKQMTSGQIRLVMEARYFENGRSRDDFELYIVGGDHGDRAWIFLRTTGDGLRSSGRWDADMVNGKSTYFTTNTTYHDTGAEAARWIEQVRAHLHKLDAHADHMLAEIAALGD